MATDPWVWLAAILTFCIYSFLYRDNPVYKAAEHLFVGVSAAYYLVIYYHNSVLPNLARPLWAAVTEGQYANYVLIIPGVLGIFFFFRFFPRGAWISRWSIAFYVGSGAGLSIPRTMLTRIIQQMQGTMVSLVPTEAWRTLLAEPSVWNGLWLVSVPLTAFGVLCTLSYFFFSRPHRGALGVTSRIGIVFLMVGFGASFGYTVMARISLLIGRMYFLLSDWLGILD